MRRNLTLLMLVFTLILTALPVNAQENTDNSDFTIMTASSYLVTVDGLRIRSTPSLSGTILGQLYQGDCLECSSSTVYADNLYWRYVVTSPSGITGWVADMYLEEIYD